jgi:hypothetical protein
MFELSNFFLWLIKFSMRFPVITQIAPLFYAFLLAIGLEGIDNLCRNLQKDNLSVK